MYAQTQQEIARSKAAVETARYQALAEIAKSGDTTARVAAVISLQAGGVQAPTGTALAAPVSNGEAALRWASILAPALTQVYGIHQNSRVAINNSDNAAAVSMNTNGTMLGLSQAGVNGIASTSATAMGTIGSVGQAGITGVGTLGGQGFTALTQLGTSGISGTGLGYQYVTPAASE